jgi:hypothetical protein
MLLCSSRENAVNSDRSCRRVACNRFRAESSVFQNFRNSFSLLCSFFLRHYSSSLLTVSYFTLFVYLCCFYPCVIFLPLALQFLPFLSRFHSWFFFPVVCHFRISFFSNLPFISLSPLSSLSFPLKGLPRYKMSSFVSAEMPWTLLCFKCVAFIYTSSGVKRLGWPLSPFWN